MEFCDECGSMMKADDGMWVCGSCGHEQPRDQTTNYVLTEGQETSEVIESSAEASGLPTTTVKCPRCEHDRAQFYMQQIRSADESETRFFICESCGHKWREDDH